MSKCLSVLVPLGPGKPPGLLVPAHAHLGSASRRTAKDSPRRPQAQDRLGRGAAREPTPLRLAFLRVLGIVSRSSRVSPITSSRVQLLTERVDSHLQSATDASDLGAPISADPVTFRGAWTHTESRARFERRRLMRMHHAIRSEDSR
jgi:hypothetical protein